MPFRFRGKKVSSIEGVLQGLKYKDKKLQNIILKYSGLDAYHTRGANTLDFWGNTGKLYWQGKEIDRHSEEYQLFLDELYLSAIKNPLYKKALLSTKDKYLMHHIGNENPNETVLTRDREHISIDPPKDDNIFRIYGSKLTNITSSETYNAYVEPEQQEVVTVKKKGFFANLLDKIFGRNK
jgi:hypothetical protein